MTETNNIHSFTFSALIISILLFLRGSAASSVNGPSIPFVPTSAAALAEQSATASAVPDNANTEINELPINAPPSSETSSTNVSNEADKSAPPPPQNPFITDAASAMAAGNFRQQIQTPPPQQLHSSDDDNNSSGGGWFGKILGINTNNSDNERQKTQQIQSNTFPPPPRGIPPPPPLPDSTTAQKQATHRQGGGPRASGSASGPPPPWVYNQQGRQQQPPPPPNPYNPRNNYANQNNYIDPDMYQRLLYDLDESTLREMTLTHEIQNLTAQMESLLIRTDVLTERLADNEANFNFVHNRNIELDANCTALTNRVSELQSQMETYEAEMAKFSEVDSEKEKTIKELREELRRVTDELEQIACLVETERFEDEKSKYLVNLKKKQQQKRKKRGFWSWLFGFGPDDATREREYESMEESERTRAARELARSTLLHALQSERASVDELEAAVATLQRNNSAIMDVVESRNSLISELNERVAVFEDDKMVLKAALRQLQKEIKEEAPKTQLLVEELEEAKRELELKELEAEEWEQRLTEMEAAENETREELELIGTYVDQLEDRLATFAVARKEIELREKKCKILEDEAEKVAQEISDYRSKVEDLTKERDESKLLIEDLVTDRAKGRRTIEKLRSEITQLNDQINDWEARLTAAEEMCEDTKSESARQLFLKIEEEKTRARAEIRALLTTKEQEMQQVLSQEKVSWEAHTANEWAQREARASTEFDLKLQTEKTMHETTLKEAVDENLRKQKEELEASFRDEMELKLEEERVMWEQLKEEEINKRISEEREVWESSIATANVPIDEDELERAAAKVYERLEQQGVSFGTSESIDPNVEAVADLLKSKIAMEEGEDEKTDVECEEEEGIPSDNDSARVDGVIVLENTDDSTGEDGNTEVEYEEEERIPSDNDSARVDGVIILENTDDSTSDDKAKDDKAADEVTNQIKQPVKDIKAPKLAPPSQPRRPFQRNVPLRSVRKAFAAATGLHGIITPSTIQLRQRHARARRKRLQRPKEIPVKDDNKSDKTSSDSDVVNELLSIRSDASSVSNDENPHSKLSSDLSPVTVNSNRHGQEQVHDNSHDATVVSWARQSNHDETAAYDDVQWPQKQNLEPPPLPDFEQ